MLKTSWKYALALVCAGDARLQQREGPGRGAP